MSDQQVSALSVGIWAFLAVLIGCGLVVAFAKPSRVVRALGWFVGLVSVLAVALAAGFAFGGGPS